jgi:hypothetical protein
MIKPPSSYVYQGAFVEVSLNQTLGLQTIDNKTRNRRAITPLVLPTPPPSGIWNIQQGSFQFFFILPKFNYCYFQHV